jgi:hypothetical protein
MRKKGLNMGKFKKRPEIVEAIQWGGHNKQIVIPGITEYDPYNEHEFTTPDKMCEYCGNPTGSHGYLNATKGDTCVVCPGDWIITDIMGDRGIIRPAIFALMYERVEENSSKVLERTYARQGEELEDIIDRVVQRLGSSNIIVLEKCTRVEVIDEKGRAYINWMPDNKAALSIQDEGQTLKVFITKG